MSAWKVLRKLLMHVSNDELGRLSVCINPQQIDTLVEYLISVCFRAYSMSLVVRQPVPRVLIDSLDRFETSVSMLLRLQQNTSMGPLRFKARMVMFLRDYCRSKYVRNSSVPDNPDLNFAYEGSTLAMYKSLS